MSRFYDRLRRRGLKSTDNPAQLALSTKVLQNMQFCEVIKADNVADYWSQAMGGGLMRAGDLPNLAPPFPMFWIEYDWPYLDFGSTPVMSKLIDAASSTAAEDPMESLRRMTIRTVGCLFVASDLLLDPGFAETVYVKSSNMYFSASEYADARWVVEILPVIESVKNKPGFPGIAGLTLLLDGEGRALGARDGSLGMMVTTSKEAQSHRESLAAGSFAAGLCAAALLTISFLHCKNVKLREETPPEKLSRRHKRKHGHGLTKYKTLEIEPMKRVLDREGKVSEKGLEQALHICRGHFKTFGGDKKLFGKYEGTYWWAQHMKGKESAGRIEKDYAVKAPR